MPEPHPSESPTPPVLSLLGKWRAGWKIAAMLGLILLFLIPIGVPYLLRQSRMRAAGVCLFYRCICRILGLKVAVRGALQEARPLLIVSNHVSYLDIFAIGSLASLAFTPKREIAAWPLVGTLCRLAGCVFIDRTPRAVEKHRPALERRLAEGERIVLFPEGTTSDGTQLLPFKSAFFRMVEWEHARSGRRLPIQPITLTYTRLDGRALTTESRAAVAWYGDAEFAPHFLALLGRRRIDAVMTIHPVFPPPDAADRKQLASECERIVGAALPPQAPLPAWASSASSPVAGVSVPA